MAFSKGIQSTEGAEVKRFIGVASCFVAGVNPTKEELEKFYGRTIDSAPQYITEVSDNNGGTIPQVRIDFLVVADPDKYKKNGTPINFKSKVTIFLRKQFVEGSISHKFQIIDKYGRTAWATQEDIDAKRIPVYSNGKQANIDINYHKAYRGEEDLINFLIAYINIPPCQKYVNGEWVMNDASELPNSEAYLEHIEDYFKGNFKELREILKYQPKNKVKVLFGIRTADDGRQFQTSYSRMFLKNSVTNYGKLAREVANTQNNGGEKNVEYDVQDLHEYEVKATNFEEKKEEDPFAGSEDSWPFN